MMCPLVEDFPGELASATHSLSFQALKRAAEAENLVFSPFAITHLLLTLAPALYPKRLG